ncbi:MAG TPA: SagB/ThcOx family dehydrogenase [Candidatus Acidoferrales bacterium]|nr:SagB/ThcOx family dehydrogenase [Candidatus Acidoferrales bacterium]
MRKCVVFVLLLSASLPAADLAGLELPRPRTTGGMPLMQALAARQSGRAFSPEKLSPQMLSNLLWAAYGINRPDGRRTAPSANNRQSVDVYAVLPDGAYLYNAKENRLEPVAQGDLRAAAGTQAFVAEAPVNLVYVSDYSKFASAPESEKALYAGAEAGFIGQNVYLFCASEGLAAVVRASIDRQALAKALKIRPDQKILLAQTVGYPKRAQ